MKIYSEIGWGNGNFISSEFEDIDGNEFRRKGFWVDEIREVYLRVWIYKRVLIISSKDGIKIQSKSLNKLKVLIGFS